jgi:hypothetical protein
MMPCTLPSVRRNEEWVASDYAWAAMLVILAGATFKLALTG